MRSQTIILTLFVVLLSLTSCSGKKGVGMNVPQTSWNDALVPAPNIEVNSSICEYSWNCRSWNEGDDRFIYANGLNMAVLCDNGYNDKLLQIERLGDVVAHSNIFKVNFYDCTQFSEDLIKSLGKINVSSVCVFGKKYDYGYAWNLHTWVLANVSGNLIPIEATGGYIIQPREYAVNYKVIEVGKCR